MNSEAIIWGVITGVAAGVLLQAIIVFVRTAFIPWYQQIIYDGVDISGEWHSENEVPDGNLSESVYQFTQKSKTDVFFIIFMCKRTTSDIY